MPDRHAIFQIEVGPLPDEIADWDDPLLDHLSEEILKVFERAQADHPGADLSLSGHIVKVVLTDDDLGYSNADRPTIKWVDTKVGHYVSTYCIHGRHGDCRLQCKFCTEKCACHCHGEPQL